MLSINSVKSCRRVRESGTDCAPFITNLSIASILMMLALLVKDWWLLRFSLSFAEAARPMPLSSIRVFPASKSI